MHLTFHSLHLILRKFLPNVVTTTRDGDDLDSSCLFAEDLGQVLHESRRLNVLVAS